MDDPTTWPEAVYLPGDRTRLRRAVRDLWSFREVAWSFGMRRIRARYKQAVFGFLWAIIQPLAFLGLFLTFLAPDSDDGAFAAGTFAALVSWQFVNSAVSGGGPSLLAEAGLLRKVYFPRECVVIGAVGSFLPDLALNLVFLSVLGPILGGHLSWYWLLIPVIAVQVVLTAYAVALPLAALTVYYRDFLYALPFLVQVWFFATPVAYTLSRVDESKQWIYAIVNPMVGPASSFRSIVAYGDAPEWRLLAASGATTALMLIGGYRWFKSLEREFAEAV
jgi:lipopolysaccharide transport system permease protein